jgi:hypothetical protein
LVKRFFGKDYFPAFRRKINLKDLTRIPKWHGTLNYPLLERAAGFFQQLLIFNLFVQLRYFTASPTDEPSWTTAAMARVIAPGVL